MPRIDQIIALLLCLVAYAGSHAAVYELPSPKDDVIGQVQHIRAEFNDTLLKIARRHDLGYTEIKLANPDVDPWLPGAGTQITLPTRFILPDTKRKGLVLNIAEMRLYYYPPEDSKYAGKVITYPVGIGREGWETPLGTTKITHTVDGPTWHPPESIREEHAKRGDPLPQVVPPGPDNPLGQYALYLGFPTYLIHGTNKPSGIGMRVSHGCIRLYPEDIAALYSVVDAGTSVQIMYEPYKAGWEGGELFLEAHPPDATGDKEVKTYTPLVQTIINATSERPDYVVDWRHAQQVGANVMGIPRVITGQESPNTPNQSQ